MEKQNEIQAGFAVRQVLLGLAVQLFY